VPSNTFNIYGRHYRTVDEMRARLVQLDEQNGREPLTSHQQDEWDALEEYVTETDHRHQMIREMAANAGNVEQPHGGIGPAEGERPRTNDAARMPFDTSMRPGMTPDRQRDMDGALRIIDAYRNSGELTAADADRLDAIVRGPGAQGRFEVRGPGAQEGLEAQYLMAVGNPHWRTAFCKLLPGILSPQGGGMGHLTLTPQEVAANTAVQRALSLTGASGGFAVPFALDPTIMPSSLGC
jgi:hypothetical protein